MGYQHSWFEILLICWYYLMQTATITEGGNDPLMLSYDQSPPHLLCRGQCCWRPVVSSEPSCGYRCKCVSVKSATCRSTFQGYTSFSHRYEAVWSGVPSLECHWDVVNYSHCQNPTLPRHIFMWWILQRMRLFVAWV